MTGEAVPETLDRIGPYRLLRQLGEGGMGVVHLGLDEEGRQVAIKVLHPHVAADLKARDRLTREVETMRRVRSPRVAAVLDAELGGRMPYIVTRFAPGRTLEETVLSDGPLSGARLARLARGLCEALMAIHAADVIHRDFKPANVMLVDDEPLVIDFGIAHLVNATRLTQTGMFVGTPGYLAPEIIRDEEITQAADVHALAATVFFGATGEPPFGTGTFESVCYNIMEGRADVDQAPFWLRDWLRAAFAVEAATRPDAHRLLVAAKALDPSVTESRKSPARAGNTRMLDTGGHDGRGTGGGRVRGAIPGGASHAGHDATHVLNGATGAAVVPDGTRVLEGAVPDATKLDSTRLDDGLPPTKRITPASEDSYSDLLPPVRYAEPDRGRRRVTESSSVPAAAGAPAAFAPPPPAPRFAPPPAPPPAPYGPPPYADQRVAGYPPPPPAPGAARGSVPPPATSRPHQPAEARRPEPAGEHSRYRTGHPLVAVLLLVVAVAAARMLPVIMSLFMVVVVLCLRVGEHLWGDLAERRSVRGSSASDPLLVVLGTPWALVRSALGTLLATPLAAMFGLCVWGGLRFLARMPTDSAAAYGAAAFVGGLFLLPGGGKPRKAVARTLTAVIRSPGAGMVVTIIVGALAFFTVVAAMSAVPSWQPWQAPSLAIADLGASARSNAMELVGGLIKGFMRDLGLGFLVFWEK